MAGAAIAGGAQAGQRVWVMGHIPPGIDPVLNRRKVQDVCGGQAPVQFLSSDKMADLMVEYADVVRLGIFGHTHMDEMRLLEPEGSGAQAADRTSRRGQNGSVHLAGRWQQSVIYSCPRQSILRNA